MSTFVPPERVSCVIAADGTPVVSLAVDQPGDLSEGSVLPDWRIIARSTLTAIVGPGDVGYLIAVDPTQMDEVKRWMRAVEAREGAMVRFVGTAQQPLESVPSDDGRPGVFVRAAS